MSEYEKEAAQGLANAILDMPPSQRSFFLGYCRGVSDAVTEAKKAHPVTASGSTGSS